MDFDVHIQVIHPWLWIELFLALRMIWKLQVNWNAPMSNEGFMDLPFELKFGPELEDWILKLG